MARKSTHNALGERARSLPRKPGVYLFKGRGEKVLYVGKAKDLRARASSYFHKAAELDQRKAVMMRQVRDLSHILTSSELEALALEANLIKQYRPRYNVVLRDDKNYPYLKLTVNEYWPRLEVVRRTSKDRALYFGPYVPAGSMWETLSFIRRNFGLRPCRYRMDEATSMKACIQHQMGRCSAPCAGLVGREEYLGIVDEVAMFLKGRRGDLLEGLRERMDALSQEMRYEEAAEVRDRIRALERAWESQKVISPELGDLDVAGLALDGGEAVVQFLFIRNGSMVGAKDFFLKDVAGLQAGEVLGGALKLFYSKEVVPPPEVLVSEEPEDAETLGEWLSAKGRKVRLRVPRRGRKRELMEMAEENARMGLESRKGGEEAVGRTLTELAERMGLDEAPRCIGAFDVSNISGSDPVGAYVHWEDGEFVKERYRQLKIKGVTGADDYAMMRESVLRVLSDMESLPDLVVIDGGRGHLEAALSVAREFARPPVLAALAKKPDRLFMEQRDEPLDLGDRLSSSFLLKRIRDEVHRFAIGFHKKLRGKRTLESPLEGIPGIGKKRRLELLKAFKGTDEIRRASVEELAAVKGMNMKAAEAVLEAFRKA
jgi:excinuclease ABC subunit C